MPAAKTTTYGFIGLGAMGGPMCRNLANKSEPSSYIRAFDVVESLVDQVVNEGSGKIKKCSSPAEVAEGADIIFTMLPEGKHVESVYTSGSNNLFSTSLENKLLIDSSTIDPAESLAIRDRVGQRFSSASFYDAPVSGGVLGAIDGTIAFYPGCNEADLNRQTIETTLKYMGRSIIFCGGPSLGLTAKLCNNYLSGILTIACSETFNVGMRAGLDPRILYAVLGAGSAQTTICDKYCPVPHVTPDSPSSHGYKGGFRMALMAKDFKLISKLAERVGARKIMGEEGVRVYSEVGAMPEYKDLDVRAMFRYLGGQEDWQ